MTVHLEDFFNKHCPQFFKSPKIAVGVSGGADSLALAHTLSDYMSSIKGGELHCLTVDHQLRAESKDEAQFVKETVTKWGNHVAHETLNWQSSRKKTSIQEQARNARFDLMSVYCKQNSIEYLALAHHADDQIETFFIRLTAGSGPDGLACMRPITERNNLKILRPLLDVSHTDCVSYCEGRDLHWIEDSSNENESFERVRFRNSMPVLEEEGLSKERILRVIARMQETNKISSYATEKAYKDSIQNIDTKHIVFKLNDILGLPRGLTHRLLRKAMDELNPNTDYGARLLKSEELVSALFEEKEGFNKRTLGGCIFSVSKDKKSLQIDKEKTA